MTVQVLGLAGGNGLSLAIPLTLGAAAGNGIIVLAGSANNQAMPAGATQSPLTGITDDTGGNTYVTLEAQGNFTNAPQVGVCLQAATALAVGDTITATFLQADNHVATALGADTALTLDLISDPLFDMSTSSQGITIGPTGGAALVLAHIVFSGNPGAVAVAAPFTLLGAVPNSGIYSCTAYATVNSASVLPAAGAFTWANSVQFGEAVYSFLVPQTTTTLPTALAATLTLT